MKVGRSSGQTIDHYIVYLAIFGLFLRRFRVKEICAGGASGQELTNQCLTRAEKVNKLG